MHDAGLVVPCVGDSRDKDIRKQWYSRAREQTRAGS